MRFALPLCAFSLVVLSGCGGPTMAPVTGCVTCNGKPVDAANIIFSPIPKTEDDIKPGKPATGFTGTDGKYVLSTYQAYDGAQVGKHRVTVSIDATNPARCQRSTKTSLEVVVGKNELNIELTP
jgi:hypothetical protein